MSAIPRRSSSWRGREARTQRDAGRPTHFLRVLAQVTGELGAAVTQFLQWRPRATRRARDRGHPRPRPLARPRGGVGRGRGHRCGRRRLGGVVSSSDEEDPLQLSARRGARARASSGAVAEACRVAAHTWDWAAIASIRSPSTRCFTWYRPGARGESSSARSSLHARCSP